MPVVPISPGSRVLPDGRQQIDAPAAAFGSLAAQGMIQGGAKLERFSDQLGRQGQEVAREEQVSRLSRAQTSIVTGLSDLGGLIDPMTNPDQIRQTWTEGLATRRAVLLEQSHPNDREWVGNQFDRDAANKGRQVGQLIEARQREGRLATLNDNLLQLGQVAARGGADLEQATGAAFAQLRLAREAGTIHADDEQQRRQLFAGSAEFNVARGLIRTNPAAAGPFIRSAQNLRPEQALTLEDGLANAQARAQARAEAAVARRERDAAIAVQTTNNLWARGIVPEGTTERVLAATRGTRLEPAARQMVADARVIGQFGAASDERQLAAMAVATERAHAPNATDADLALPDTLGRIRTAQREDLRSNGLARAVADGVIPAPPPWNPADPAVVQQYVSGAQTATAHYRTAVSALTPEVIRHTLDQFSNAQPAGRLAIVRAFASIEDPDVRRASFQHLERARGDGGSIPTGMLPRIADMSRDGFEGEQAALHLLASLAAPTSDRVRQAGEAPELRTALERAQHSSVQGALQEQMLITNNPATIALLNRDMEAIRKDAATRMAAGVSPAEAVAAAQALVNHGRGQVVQEGLGAVYFPLRQAQPATVETALRVLQGRALDVEPDGPLEADAALAFRQRREATRSARWSNDGNGFSLVALGAAGTPVVLQHVSIAEAVAIGTTHIRSQAAERAAEDRLRRPAVETPATAPPPVPRRRFGDNPPDPGAARQPAIEMPQR